MPLYTPEDDGFDQIADPFRWFENLMVYEYGEIEAPEPIPEALNWILKLPIQVQLGLDDADCSLVYRSDSGYLCSVWDVTGPDDLPWATFLADAYGVRLLPEYSLLKDEAGEAELEAVLQHAADTLPSRLLADEFTRQGDPVAIPAFLLTLPDEEE